MDEFMEAMPPATRSVHLLPAEIASQVEGFRPLASDAHLFMSPETQTFTHPNQKEEPHNEDESIWRIDNANDIGKDQGMSGKDETEITQKNYQDDPIEHQPRLRVPLTSDEYERDLANQSNRRDARAAMLMADYDPVLMSYQARRAGKVAMRWDGIIAGLKSTIVQSSRDCKVRLIKANPAQGRWTFKVQSSGSSDSHTVHLKAAKPKGSSAQYVPKLDLKMGCSCNFWKWQGPDHHAARHGYLDRKPRSNGAAPTVKDPGNQNRVCKHVYACSDLFLNYALQRKKASSDTFYNRAASAGAQIVKRDGPSRRLKAMGLQLDNHVGLVDEIFAIAEALTHTG